MGPGRIARSMFKARPYLGGLPLPRPPYRPLSGCVAMVSRWAPSGGPIPAPQGRILKGSGPGPGWQNLETRISYEPLRLATNKPPPADLWPGTRFGGGGSGGPFRSQIGDAPGRPENVSGIVLRVAPVARSTIPETFWGKLSGIVLRAAGAARSTIPETFRPFSGGGFSEAQNEFPEPSGGSR